jgi:hypothetical protein
MGEQAARALARRLERPVEVLNFGINGYNSTQELAVLRNVALDFRPDVVVLVPTNNDHEPAAYADADGFLSASPSHPITRRRDQLAAAAERLLRTSDLPIRAPSMGARSEVRLPSAAIDPTWMTVPVDDAASALDTSVGRPVRAMIDAPARPARLSPSPPSRLRRVAAFRRVRPTTPTRRSSSAAPLPEAHSWAEVLARFSSAGTHT